MENKTEKEREVRRKRRKQKDDTSETYSEKKPYLLQPKSPLRRRSNVHSSRTSPGTRTMITSHEIQEKGKSKRKKIAPTLTETELPKKSFDRCDRCKKNLPSCVSLYVQMASSVILPENSIDALLLKRC
jgi:hypothetical protein